MREEALLEQREIRPGDLVRHFKRETLSEEEKVCGLLKAIAVLGGKAMDQVLNLITAVVEVAVVRNLLSIHDLLCADL